MKHLKEINMGYWSHLFFALGLSAQLVIIAICGCIHAVAPFFFENYVSSKVKALNTKFGYLAS